MINFKSLSISCKFPFQYKKQGKLFGFFILGKNEVNNKAFDRFFKSESHTLFYTLKVYLLKNNDETSLVRTLPTKFEGTKDTINTSLKKILPEERILNSTKVFIYQSKI